jgi:photosystem II stability/assembly factor-like uncharacterized protein
MKDKYMTITRTANRPITFSGQTAAYNKGNKEQSRIIIGNSNVPKQFTNDIIEYEQADPTGNPIIYTNDANAIHCVLQDIGKNWSAGIPVGTSIKALAYAGNGIVIAGDGTTGDIYRSTDFGLTWNTIVPTVGNSIQLALTYADNNGVVISGDANTGDIYRSTDFGLTWNTIVPKVGSSIFALTYADNNGDVIAGDFNTGNIYRSIDFGLHWSTIPPIGGDIDSLTYTANGIVIAGSDGNIFRSIDFGSTWGMAIPVGPGDNSLFALTYADNNGVVIAGDGAGSHPQKIYRSTNFGSTWNTVFQVETFITALTYAGNGIVIGGDLNTGDIYRSTDFGLTWNTITPVGSGIWALTNTGNGIVIAGDNNGNIYRSVPTIVCH